MGWAVGWLGSRVAFFRLFVRCQRVGQATWVESSSVHIRQCPPVLGQRGKMHFFPESRNAKAGQAPNQEATGKQAADNSRPCLVVLPMLSQHGKSQSARVHEQPSNSPTSQTKEATQNAKSLDGKSQLSPNQKSQQKNS